MNVGYGRDKEGRGERNDLLFPEQGKNVDTVDSGPDLDDHLGANHHTKECESGKRRTFGTGRNMLGVVKRGI